MAKRRIVIFLIAVCLCICFILIPCSAQVVSTTDINEPISTDNECSLTMSYCYEGLAFPDLEVKLYKISTVSADYRYTLTSPYEDSGLVLNGIQTTGEWNIIRSTLETYILANTISPDLISTTSDNGQVNFQGLKVGLYLAVTEQADHEEQHYYFDSMLVHLPGIDTYNHWQYEVAVTAKGTLLPPITPDENIELKVLKLWKGDNQSDRPKSIEVEIFCNGTSQETVFLSEETSWTYTWLAKNDGSTWKVVERNIPDGYTMTVEERETSFVLTNTATTPPVDPPSQTGDTSNVLLYIVLMIISGSALIIIGIFGKRKSL